MVFVSDASRQPVRPEGGWIALGDGPRMPLRWDGQKMMTADVPGVRTLAVELLLEDGSALGWTFEELGD